MSLAHALASNTFSVTAELPLPGYLPVSEIVQQANDLAPFVDAVQVAEIPQQNGHMSPAALASLLLAGGIDPVIRLNCRDSNRRGLQRELVGLKALGVTSLIVSRDYHLQYPGTLSGKPVFDINGRDLIALAADIGEDQPGVPGVDFMIGARATVFSPRADWKGELLKSKSRAGARFLQTQPCFSVPMLSRYMQRLVEQRITWNCAIIVTLAPLPGMDAARWQFENARGTVLPKSLVKELAESTNAEQLGIEICARQMREIAAIPGISGVNLMTLGNPSAVQAAIEMSGLRNSRPSGSKH